MHKEDTLQIVLLITLHRNDETSPFLFHLIIMRASPRPIYPKVFTALVDKVEEPTVEEFWFLNLVQASCKIRTMVFQAKKRAKKSSFKKR